MEENPPEQSSRPQAGREVPHSRTPRAAFSTPEQSQPEAKPTRQSDAKGAPPVTFQPPPGEADDAPPRSTRKATPRSKSSPGTPAESTTPVKRSGPTKPADPAAPADSPAPTVKAPAVKAPTVKAPHAKATPRKAPARKTGLAARTEITPAKAFPQQTTGAKKAATPAKQQGEKRGASTTRPDARMPDAAAKLTELRDTSLRPRTPRQSSPAAPAAHPDAAPATATPPTDPATATPAADTGAGTPAGEPDTTPPADERVETLAGQPVANVPAETPNATTPVDESGPEVSGDGTTLGAVAGQVRRTVNTVWDTIAADPWHTPELLALTAVQAIGPRAAGWAREIRVSYPGATADGVGRLAVRRFTRRSGVNAAIAAMTGGYAPLALWGVGAYHQAELVLHVAAAYGLDPADPARAVELLVLTRMHLTPEGATAAMAAAQVAEPTAPTAAWRLGRTFAVHAGGWAVLRRILPGGAVVAAAVTSHTAMETLGARATAFYRAARR